MLTKMTREEFETELIARLEDIKALYKKYNPTPFENNKEYLSMCIIRGNIHANNTDKECPVDVSLLNGKFYSNNNI